jgi:hypothetical protein
MNIILTIKHITLSIQIGVILIDKLSLNYIRKHKHVTQTQKWKAHN